MADQMRSYLDFEKPVAELEAKIDELRTLAANGSDIGDEIAKIEAKSAQALAELYANLTPWQKTLVARHPLRPLPGRADLRDGPGKGQFDREPHQAQFWHGAAGRLSQGGAADGDGRPFWHTRAL